jgi:N6-adenosine-specific RNA methylase IME4
MSTKKYKVIYADPPWKTKAGRAFNGYAVVNGKQIFNSIDNTSRELAYNTMTVDEICDMPISEIVDDNAHLYMWVTNQYLLQAEKVIHSWGFRYSTTLVWAKNPMGGGLGGNYKITTEFLIFATRGSLAAKEKHIGTWFNIKREYENGAPCHSRKPKFFSELIEKVSPGPYLEVFARKQHEGWDVFGNQIKNSININPMK